MTLLYLAIGTASVSGVIMAMRLYNQTFVWKRWQDMVPPEKRDAANLLSGKTIIITGANCGIGKEVATEIYRQGAQVILACRNEQETRKVMENIEKSNGSSQGHLEFHSLDLSSFESIVRFTDGLDANVDMLINNAGAYGLKFNLEHGPSHEPNMMVNHYGPALLTMRMLDKGVKRVINVSSALACGAKVERAQLHKMYSTNVDQFNNLKLSDKQNYASSKLASALFMSHLASQTKGVEFGLASPGFALTRLHRNVSKQKLVSMIFFAPLLLMIMRTPKQGAQTIIGCALVDKLEPDALYHSGKPNRQMFDRIVNNNSSLSPEHVYELTLQYLKDYL